MDACIVRVGQLREHTEAFLRITCKSARLRERFQERFQEHAEFWEALQHTGEEYMRQYVIKMEHTHDWVENAHLHTSTMETAVAATAGATVANCALQPGSFGSTRKDVKRPKRSPAAPCDLFCPCGTSQARTEIHL